MGSSWHYQVMRHAEEGEEWYGVHEYYLMEDGPAWTENPLISGDSVAELKEILLRMLSDIDKRGVIDYEG